MNEQRKDKKIATSSFLKYFIMGVPGVELSDKAIREYLLKWQNSENIQEAIKTSFDDLDLRGQLNELLTKLKTIYIDMLPLNVVNALIQFIYTNIESFSDQEVIGIFNSLYDNASSLLLWLINNHFDREKIPAKLEEVITNTPSFYFKAFVTLFCKKERGDLYNIYQAIDINIITAKTSQLFEKHYVEENHDVFDEVPNRKWGLILYQWGTNWGLYNSTNPQKVNEYILRVLSNSIKKFLIFIDNEAKNNQQIEKDQYIFNIQQLAQIYDIASLKMLGENYKNEKELTNDEKTMMEQFIEQCNRYLVANMKS